MPKTHLTTKEVLGIFAVLSVSGFWFVLHFFCSSVGKLDRPAYGGGASCEVKLTIRGGLLVGIFFLNKRGV